MFISKLIGCILFIQIHGIEVNRRLSALQRLSLKAADLVLCVSRDTRRNILRRSDVVPERVRVHPNTVSDDFTPGDRSIARKKFGWEEDRFVLLSVGRLSSAERYKGHDRVIKLLPKLLSVKPSVNYVISGEGDDLARLEKMCADCGVSHAVTFLGYVPRADLCDLYRAADLFVLPSSGEGFGIVFLEAMACGTPALGLGVAGAKDALVDGALGQCPSYEELEAALLGSLNIESRGPFELSLDVHKRFGFEVFAVRATQLFYEFGRD
jgi:phosphatidylinositol alpha-1,6-mannosyltransferase